MRTEDGRFSTATSPYQGCNNYLISRYIGAGIAGAILICFLFLSLWPAGRFSEDFFRSQPYAVGHFLSSDLENQSPSQRTANWSAAPLSTSTTNQTGRNTSCSSSAIASNASSLGACNLISSPAEVQSTAASIEGPETSTVSKAVASSAHPPEPGLQEPPSNAQSFPEIVSASAAQRGPDLHDKPVLSDSDEAKLAKVLPVKPEFNLTNSTTFLHNESVVHRLNCPHLKSFHFDPLVLSDEENIKQQAVDDEILAKAKAAIAQSATDNGNKERGKVAFLFLTHGALPLAALWEQFFEGHEGEYAIHIHSSNKSFVYNNSTTSFAGFHNRQVPSIQIKWGSFTMVTATRRLLATALLDPSVQRLALFSES